MSPTLTQMKIIRTIDSLKWKLLFGTSRDKKLRRYMSLSRLLITNYRDLVKKLVDKFATSKHKKLPTTNLFNIFQGPSESFREYLT